MMTREGGLVDDVVVAVVATSSTVLDFAYCYGNNVTQSNAVLVYLSISSLFFKDSEDVIFA